MDPDNHGYYKVVWADTGTDVEIKGGEIAGLLEARDKIMRENINDVNASRSTWSTSPTRSTANGSAAGRDQRGLLPPHHDQRQRGGNHDLTRCIADVTAIFRWPARINRCVGAIGIAGTLTFVTNREPRPRRR